MKILVCDDEQSRGDEIVKSIEQGRKIKPKLLAAEELRDEFGKFYKAVNPCLNDPPNCHGKPDVLFNDPDIIVLDNNLATLDRRKA